MAGSGFPVRVALAVALAGTLFAGCASGPAEAQSVRSISATDKRQGAEAHPQLLAEFGGAYDGPQAAYVARVGKRVAVQSGLSNSEKDFTVTLLNSPVNNAFAIPGGYVYVTRQLVALMNDEAELASVLGHEIGHVAARHSSKRQTRSTVTSIGAAILSAVTGSDIVGQIAGQAGQLYTLSYSRSQEYDADDLGIRYMARAGYDPRAAGEILDSLDRQSRIDAQAAGRDDARSVPTWASTHPNTPDRVARATRVAVQTGIPAAAQRNRDAFLNAIDGMVYDDDPRQGVIDGRWFRHPDLKLAFQVPQGFAMTNSPNAVMISGNGGQAQFGGGAIGEGLEPYVIKVLRGLGATGDVPAPRTGRVNGLDMATAVTGAQNRSGPVDVGVTAYCLGNAAYHFVTITPAGSGVGPFQPMIESLRRLSDAEAAQIKPHIVDVVTVKAGDTVRSLATRMAYADNQLERFLTLNALDANTVLRPGDRVKLIVQGR